MAVLMPKAQTYDQDRILYQTKYERPFRLTPYIVTFSEGTITNIDIQKFLEAGLRIVRFKMSHVVKKDKLALLAQLKKAIHWYCKKYEASMWPVAISIDLPNACIRTGYLHHDIKNTVNILKDSLVELTSEFEYWNKCDDKRIFIDDSFTLATITPGTEISIDFGGIIMICTKVITDTRLQCKVVIGGKLGNGMFVCLRGVRLRRPPISKLDIHLLEFVKEHELDLITIHSIRTAETIGRIRAFFIGCPVPPLIMCSICEQQGLDNIEAIVKASDGIILGREFLAQAIINPNRMTTIQLYVSSICRKLGKPFYISGNVMEETLKYGSMSCKEISDVTNGILQGAGFVLKNYASAANVVNTMRLLDDICKAIETISTQDISWRIAMELKPPLNAAEAAVLACALAVRQTGSKIVIVLTVSGWTAVKLSRLEPEAAILTVSANAAVARQLQLFRGIIPVIYQHKGIEDWHVDMYDRINFAIQYGLKHDLIKYNQTYVVLRKASPTSAFCDQVSSWKVHVEESKKYRLVCPEHSSETARHGAQPRLVCPEHSSETARY